ncbi:MAG TPA: LysR family transcriptional regulator [Gammaproteobacteria bacterium]|nr:LysR family transcriptional regulator [Gammaproteobacteria bacterium]
MNITLRQLKVFEAVARNTSFTRAAEELHLTQPAVSMQVKQLEEHVGLALFEQLGKKIFLTSAGQEMYYYSRAIAQQLEEAERVLDEMKGVRGGRLAVAVASTANHFATRLLATFSRRYDNPTISLDVTNRKGLLRHLEANDIDMVIMGRPPRELDLAAESFTENPLVVIAPTDHPLAGSAQIPFDRLQNETFVIREPGSGTRVAMERFFREQGVALSTGMEMSSNEAIKQAVEAGLGLGIVSEHTLELELETHRLVILDVEHFPILRHWYVVHRKGKRLSPVAQVFKEFVLKEGAAMARLDAYQAPGTPSG